MEQWEHLPSSPTFVLVPCIIPRDSLLTDFCPHAPSPQLVQRAAVRVGPLTPMHGKTLQQLVTMSSGVTQEHVPCVVYDAGRAERLCGYTSLKYRRYSYFISGRFPKTFIYLSFVWITREIYIRLFPPNSSRVAVLGNSVQPPAVDD